MPNLPNNMRPKKLTKQELLDVLMRIVVSVRANDSFDGSIEYAANTPDDYDVMASFRVGNSEGQGGVVLIGENVEPAPPPSELIPTNALDSVASFEAAEKARIARARELADQARLAKTQREQEQDDELEAILAIMQPAFEHAANCDYHKMVLETNTAKGGYRVYTDTYQAGVERLTLKVIKDDEGFFYRLEAIPQDFEFEGNQPGTDVSHKWMVTTRDRDVFARKIAEYLGKFLAHHGAIAGD